MDTRRVRLTAVAGALLVMGTAGAPARAAALPALPQDVGGADASSTAPMVLHLAGLTTGAQPSIAYIRGTHFGFQVGDYTLRRPDGTTLRLPDAPWSQWSPMGLGAIGSFGSEGGPQVQVVTGTGHVTRSTSYHFGLAVSPDRSIVGWLVGRLNTPHVVEGGGHRSYDLPRVGHGVRLGTIAGVRTCKELPPEGGGCTAFVDTYRDRGVWVSASHGFVEKVGPMRSVNDVDARSRLIGRTADTDGSRCFAMWKTDLHQKWQTCDARLVAFAPEGRHVLGLGPVEEKTGGARRVDLYDDSGNLVASYSTTGGDHVDQVAWEDRSHVLATVFELGAPSSCPGSCRGHWAVVRLGLDGSAELATPVVKGQVDYRPWSLPLT